MGPARRLDGRTLRANVAAFTALGAPVAAVVKADGYGWGARTLARELDDVVESYVVNDDDELAALRPATNRPVRLLADVPAARLARVVALGGIANVSSREALAAAAAEAGRRGGLTVRVGVHDAAGWSAIRAHDAGEFAAAFAGTPLAVELWTHLSSTQREQQQLDRFIAVRETFRRAGVRIVSSDVAGTAAAQPGLGFDRLRIGIGLFGARLGAAVELRCALRLFAPEVRRFAPGERAWAGYGERAVPVDRPVAVLRCGYADGYPKGMSGTADILSVGMQYTMRLAGDRFDPRVLIGESDDLDTLAARAHLSAHELVTGLACR